MKREGGENPQRPHRLVDQVIGQDRAVNIARLAAYQRRFLFLIGEPGTGKSLLGRAVAELLPKAPACIVSVEANRDDPSQPRVVCEDPQSFSERKNAIQSRLRGEAQSQRLLLLFTAAGSLLLLAYAVAAKNNSAYGPAVLMGLFAFWQMKQSQKKAEPDAMAKVLYSSFGDAAPFIDATACLDGALLGDVRHDPFQSGGSETAPHLLVEPGAVHKAHGGVLYIDEIGNLSIRSQRLLLTAIQDRALPISGRQSGSSGRMICTEAVPCDFVLIAAGNPEDLAKLSPALRSRFVGYGYEVLMQSQMPDTEDNRNALKRFVAQEIAKDGRIPSFSSDAVSEIIAEARRRAGQAGQLTTRLRDLGGLIRAAGDLAAHTGLDEVHGELVQQARTYALSIEEQISN